MSRNSDEIVMELAAALGGMEKLAAKKEEKEEPKKDKKEEKEEKKEDKKDKKEEKDEKDKKKAKALMEIVNGLAKLASELDEMGAEDASSLVDDALKVIVYNIEDEEK
jgi:hypothetical protein